jgi:hypothetical protein
MWVEAARRWAGFGVTTLRLDLEGIGEADGEPTPYHEDGSLYIPDFIPMVLSVLDSLEARGVASRFLLGGLCAGAYWAFHAAAQDDRVCAALMLNPRALVWEHDLLASRDLRKLFTDPFDLAKIRRNATPERTRAVIGLLMRAPSRQVARLRHPARRPLDEAGDVDALLERLHISGKRVLMLFSEDEPLHEELMRSGRLERITRWQNFEIRSLPVRDHTLRPNWAQQQAHSIIDRAVQAELMA